MKKYKITYQVEVSEEGKTLEEIEADPIPMGACDQIIVHSIILPGDGSRSEYIFSFDGETKAELPDNELFKSWTMMTNRLAKSKTLHPNKKGLCETVFDCIKTAMLSAQGTCSDENCCVCQEEPVEKTKNMAN